MQIQWYPGHMHKARQAIQNSLPKVDLVIEILDARIPFSSTNPLLAELRGDKPCIQLLSKSDLADPALTREWQTCLEAARHVKTMALSTQQPEKMRQVSDLCHKLLPNRSRDGSRLQAMIMGIPNVGKSTLINILAGRSIAKTGNEPAITRMQQRIQLDSRLTLLDTPGMLWPRISHAHIGYRLAATGAIKDSALEHTDLALFVLAYLQQTYPQALQRRFQLADLPDKALPLLEMIGRQRGCLRSRGLIHLDKAAKILLTELRSGGLGPVSLETPATRVRELAEIEHAEAERAAKKAARKQKWKQSYPS